MFCGCKSLISLPDISKWNTDGITEIYFVFLNCNSLISFPDLSKIFKNMKWRSILFNDCFNSLYVPIKQN